MADARRTDGAPALLFERLTQPLDRHGAPAAVARIHDIEALRNSVIRELRSLLNTRVALDIDTLESRARTTIDYGIPDLSAFPIGDSEAVLRLARHISRTISVYEPRLHVRDVALEPLAGQKDGLLARVSGSIEVGAIVEPVSFAIAVGEVFNAADDS
jgi:type VI secretion system lysozyme-like protein